MKDIDLNKLKELAQHVNYGEFTVGESGFGVESSDGTFADCLGMDEASFIYAANPAVVLALIERLKAAERERDQASERLVLVREQRDSELKRNMELEAEFARRDAAAGEPVAWATKSHHWPVTTFAPAVRDDWIRRGCEVMALYTAAQPAVLPPEMELNHLPFVEGYNQCISDAKALGYQPEKVVMLPELEKWRSVDAVRAQGAYRVLMQKSLDDAGVKWEVYRG